VSNINKTLRAERIEGIDVSERMLAGAKETTDAPSITYIKADMEHLELQPKSFGLVYSSLALHYVENLNELMAQAHRSLVPGGALVFSVEHPIFTAPSRPNWAQDAAGRKTWPIDGYLDEGPRSTDWLAKGVIKQHRTLATYINMLIEIGLVISHVEEWVPTPAQIAEQPNWADERQRPPFLIVAAVRPGGAANQAPAQTGQTGSLWPSGTEGRAQ